MGSSNTTWLITGCSSGFGLEIAQVALRAGHNVIATSRNPNKAPDAVSAVTSKTNGKWLALDVTASQDSITKTMAEAESVFGPIDILVNNAAYAVLGAAEEVPEDVARKEYETNYWGPVKIIRAVLPSMRQRKSGTIVNVSSIAGMTALPTAAFYSGSKWALEGMSESSHTFMAHVPVEAHATHSILSRLTSPYSTIGVSFGRTSDL
jgi:NAD(P)-dependent dehydrogenase (short-subunit alcohol dehydrogenase family)